jgi:hypothetical protein
MKSNVGVKISLLMLAAILNFSGCNEEHKSTTKINSDGSCERTIRIKADSSYIHSGYFPIPIDKNWSVKWSKVEKDSQKVCTMHKNFKDVNDINNDYGDKNKSGVFIKFEKKFRWFFTYHNYLETYKEYNAFNKTPLQSYLNKEEFSKYLSGDTTKVLKERLDKYLMSNILDYFVDELIISASSLKDPSLPPKLFSEKRNEIHAIVEAEKSNEPKEIINALSKIIKSKSLPKLENDVRRILDNLTKKLEANDIRYSFINEVIMPGIILNTNASAIEGNKVLWNFSAERFHYADLIMTVESRTTNLWAVVITAIACTVIIVLLILPRFRKSL